MYNFRNRIAQFMYGRNGVDSLTRFLLLSYLLLAALNLFLGSILVWALESALMVWALFRCLSRNTFRRQEENRKYLKIKIKVTQFCRRQVNRVKYRKTKVYKKCPACKSILCLPRKKGNHMVKCPSCSHRFDVHI